MGEVASSVKEAADSILAEVAAANGVATEDADAPHEIEADEHCVATFGDTAPETQQDVV